MTHFTVTSGKTIDFNFLQKFAHSTIPIIQIVVNKKEKKKINKNNNKKKKIKTNKLKINKLKFNIPQPPTRKFCSNKNNKVVRNKQEIALLKNLMLH